MEFKKKMKKLGGAKEAVVLRIFPSSIRRRPEGMGTSPLKTALLRLGTQFIIDSDLIDFQKKNL